jgi:hypothetical protein
MISLLLKFPLVTPTLEFGTLEDLLGIKMEFPFLPKQNITQRFDLQDELV